MKIMFAKQGWMNVSEALNGVHCATFERSFRTKEKVARNAIQEQETEMGIELTLTQSSLSKFDIKT
jgi:hypothetical protein